MYKSINKYTRISCKFSIICVCVCVYVCVKIVLRNSSVTMSLHLQNKYLGGKRRIQMQIKISIYMNDFYVILEAFRVTS